MHIHIFNPTCICLILTVCALDFGNAFRSCGGRCSLRYNQSYNCQCNIACPRYGNCCSDYVNLCQGSMQTTQAPTTTTIVPTTTTIPLTSTCLSRCGASFQPQYACQCNTACSSFKNCCPDFSRLCQGRTPERRTTRKTTTIKITAPLPPRKKVSVSDSELSRIITKMWDSDTNAAINGNDFRISVQSRTSFNNKQDKAPSRLFSTVGSHLLQRNTYKSMVALFDNYIPDTGRAERVSRTELQENQKFLDAILQTSVMKEAWRFLYEKGYSPGSSTLFRKQLNDIWFTLYSRQAGKQDSSGFEHVFVGEIKNGKVSGMHNWIRFYMLEKLGKLDYKGYRTQKLPHIIATQFTWNGKWKQVGTFFLGTSPEFEIGLYTICFLTRPNKLCTFNINKTRLKVQTFNVSYLRTKTVASAYPDV